MKTYSTIRCAVLLVGMIQPSYAQLDTVGFPLAIGNKWFYRFQSIHPPSPLLIVKTIVDTTQTGARVVRVGTATNDSIGTETWSTIDGSFYANSLRVYNASLTRDTTWETHFYGVDRYTYQLRRVTLFGSSSKCQILLQYHFSSLTFPATFGHEDKPLSS